jgi:hypothetical protein
MTSEARPEHLVECPGRQLQHPERGDDEPSALINTPKRGANQTISPQFCP